MHIAPSLPVFEVLYINFNEQKSLYTKSQKLGEREQNPKCLDQVLKRLMNTEIVDLSRYAFWSRKCSATLPHYPKKLYGTTGQFLEDAAIICGGGEPATNECFSLRKNGTFESIAPMKEARYLAKSIVTQGRIWIVGGKDKNGEKLSSTEYIPKSSNNEPSIPEPVESFSIISINETTSMLIGGSKEEEDVGRVQTNYFAKMI